MRGMLSVSMPISPSMLAMHLVPNFFMKHLDSRSRTLGCRVPASPSGHRLLWSPDWSMRVSCPMMTRQTSVSRSSSFSHRFCFSWELLSWSDLYILEITSLRQGVVVCSHWYVLFWHQLELNFRTDIWHAWRSLPTVALQDNYFMVCLFVEIIPTPLWCVTQTWSGGQTLPMTCGRVWLFGNCCRLHPVGNSVIRSHILPPPCLPQQVSSCNWTQFVCNNTQKLFIR